jgi:hypothetical protein
MSVESIKRRLARLSEASQQSAFASVASTLEVCRERAGERRDAGLPPLKHHLEPPPPPGASRADREMWRKIAQGRARVVLMPNNEFDALQAAYAMNDADLWRTVSQREQAT